MMALGLIETRGLLAAVEGADAMLKTADVRLLEKNLVGGGLVTITVAGIRRISDAALVSEHVIARPDLELERILVLRNAPDADQEAKDEPVAPKEEPSSLPDETASPEAVEDAPGSGEAPDLSQLKKMSLNRLRQKALTLPGIALTAGEIGSADKKTLITAIINAYGQQEE